MLTIHSNEKLRRVVMLRTGGGGPFMQLIDAIRSIILAMLFLFAAPIVGLVAALTHDRRYDELLDDW